MNPAACEGMFFHIQRRLAWGKRRAVNLAIKKSCSRPQSFVSPAIIPQPVNLAKYKLREIERGNQTARSTMVVDRPGELVAHADQPKRLSQLSQGLGV